ncbi:bifunctional folylpolyglutamate synthase/dihydrofolate synthase [Sandaracinobacter neustonicus]|uniref:tetrahydrofolate synthase n=1 Tax=Sandaracinobacter neustonicus TaxID=1715348 RepID=A0A501XF78_9SPHN|nr:folylpolyglutamate synthase/dihydrofolate synthase family protein [Sandaracinobacter neustonicus]TPE59195.1 bifunctional folylpolyglutamate synthase/dihydrofolate synthase [Sandaracinobacter neustonicus]
MSLQPADFARSDHPVLDRLLKAAGQQRVQGVDLTLDRIERLLKRMASPHLKLPPVFHVAGTNGKGSTTAFLRAGLEASGHRVHMFTSPHLVRVNERIRVAGTLVSDEDFAEALAEVLKYNASQPLSFFEAITAAAFLLFAATPADATILEVGLGGRLDSTNVVPKPLVTGIASLSLDHVAILGPTLRHIAAEKAGIAKRGVPLVTQKYPAQIAGAVAEVAIPRGAKLMARGEAWDAAAYEGALGFRLLNVADAEPLKLPIPKLPGAHQLDNAALSVAMIRAQDALSVPDSALRSAMGWAQWPARLQRLTSGPLAAMLPAGSELWLDGGHNPAAGKVLAAHLAQGSALPAHLVMGLLPSKDFAGFIRSFPRGTRMTMVPIPGHPHVPPAELAALANTHGMKADTAGDVEAALAGVNGAGRVLICGSLHLAGEVLRVNGPLPV